MSGGKLLDLSDAPAHGLLLPKLPSTKFKNLLSADGQTYYLLPTPVKLVEKLSGGKTKTTVLEFAERHPGKGIDAIFVGIKRGMSTKPIDCSYMDSKSVLVHSTSNQEIVSMVERYARFKSGASLAVFDLPANVRNAVSVKPGSVSAITFSGRAGAKAVHVNVEFKVEKREGGIGSFDAELRGDVQKTFKAQIGAKAFKRYLWDADFAIRLNEHGIFEVDSGAMDGTIYLAGKLI